MICKNKRSLILVLGDVAVGVLLRGVDTKESSSSSEHPQDNAVHQVSDTDERIDLEVNSAALLMACHEGQLEVVDKLLERSEIEVNNADQKGKTPLFKACAKGHIEIVKKLLERDEIEVNKASDKYGAPLHVACKNNHLETVEKLLERNEIEVNKARADDDATPLYQACKNCHLEIVEKLLEQSLIDVNKGNDKGSTPLFVACAFGYLEIVEKLLERNETNVNKAMHDRATPLYMACGNGYLEIVKRLLDRTDIDLNAKVQGSGYTSLMAASQGGHIEIVRALIKHPKTDFRDCQLATQIAFTAGKDEIATLLRKHLLAQIGSSSVSVDNDHDETDTDADLTTAIALSMQPSDDDRNNNRSHGEWNANKLFHHHPQVRELEDLENQAKLIKDEKTVVKCREDYRFLLYQYQQALKKAGKNNMGYSDDDLQPHEIRWHAELKHGQNYEPVPPQLFQVPKPQYNRKDPITKKWIQKPIEIPLQPEGTIRLVMISDTHGYPLSGEPFQVPDGDILLHAGDFTHSSELKEFEAFSAWFDSLPHKHKIVIAGNHDGPGLDIDRLRQWSALDKVLGKVDENVEMAIANYDKARDTLRNKSFTFLDEEAVTVMGLKIYGTCWGPYSRINEGKLTLFAYGLPREDLKKHWDRIPSDTDILMTHTPPLGRNDLTNNGMRVGDEFLLHTVQERVKPMVHVYGHIHEQTGACSDGVTTFVNASFADPNYHQVMNDHRQAFIIDVVPPDNCDDLHREAQMPVTNPRVESSSISTQSLLPKQFTIIRHAQSQANSDGSDARDSPLSQEGRKQAETLALSLHNFQLPDVIVVSPMQRTLETFWICLGKRIQQEDWQGQFIVDANIRETNYVVNGEETHCNQNKGSTWGNETQKGNGLSEWSDGAEQAYQFLRNRFPKTFGFQSETHLQDWNSSIGQAQVQFLPERIEKFWQSDYLKDSNKKIMMFTHFVTMTSGFGMDIYTAKWNAVPFFKTAEQINKYSTIFKIPTNVVSSLELATLVQCADDNNNDDDNEYCSPALGELMENNDGSRVEAALNLILKIISNIIAHPNESKYRIIKKSSKGLNSKILNLSSGVEFLLEIGFEENDKYFVNTLPISVLTQYEEDITAALASTLIDEDNTDQDADLAEALALSMQ